MGSGGEESLFPLTNSENGATWGQHSSLYQVNQASDGLHWTRTGSHHLGWPRKEVPFPLTPQWLPLESRPAGI